LYKHYVISDSLDLRLLGLANVKFVITGKRTVTSSNLHSLYSAEGLTVYENLLCKPRVYFAYKSKVVENDSSSIKELLRPDFDGSTALFTKEDGPPDVHKFTEGKNTIHFDRSEN